jgi:TctA family transporter
MGLILGGLVEEKLSLSILIYDNNWFRFFESWIVNMFFGLTAISLSWPLISKLMQRKAKKAEQ